AENAVLLDVIVVGLEGRAVALQPLLAFTLSYGVGDPRFEHLGKIQLQAPGALEQALIDAEVGGALAPAGCGAVGHSKRCAANMRIVYAHPKCGTTPGLSPPDKGAASRRRAGGLLPVVPPVSLTRLRPAPTARRLLAPLRRRVD